MTEQALGTSWHGYPSLFNLGHKCLANLFVGPVVIQEKVDGSQFSFGVFDGEVRCRSKGAQLDMEHPQEMFVLGVELAKRLAPQLRNGYTYRGEFLNKPKHNVLAYDRAPRYNVIIYDIQRGEEDYLSPAEVKAECDRLGLETVPVYHQGDFVPSIETLSKFLDNTSILGGQKVEGFVVKNYAQFGTDKKILIGKYVSADFKEVHAKEWGEANPGQGDILAMLTYEYKTPARWNKAIQHMRDAGKLTDSVKDIGLLLKEVNVDILKECEEEIKAKVWKWLWPKLSRGLVQGFPDYYKKYLLEQSLPSITDVRGESTSPSPDLRSSEGAITSESCAP